MAHPLDVLRHHVSGAIARGESEAIKEMPMIGVYESHGMRKTLLSEWAAFADAKRTVLAMGVVALEDDRDHADCADAYTLDGRIICIQPVNFTLF